MLNYKLEISDLSLVGDELNIRVKVICDYCPSVLSPKIKLLFSQGSETRRLPMNIDSYTNTNDFCEIIASGKYYLSPMFLNKSSNEITASFSIFYGSSIVDNADIQSNVACDNVLISDSQLVICSYSYNPANRAIKDFSLKKKLVFYAKSLFVLFAKIYYKILCKSPVVDNRVSFISGRTDTLEGNSLCVYNELKKEEGIDFQFLTFSSATGHYDFKNIVRFLKLYASSSVVVVDDYFRLLNYAKKRNETVLFQLWHACGAFKTFGFTRLNRIAGPNQFSHNHRMYDYAIVSSSNIARYYAEGFGLSDEKVIATGIPRTDAFFDEDHADSVREKIYLKYPTLRNKKILLFAPTFRGTGQMNAYYPLDKLDVQKLYDDLNGEYFIIIKMHPFCKERYSIDDRYKNCIFDMSGDSDINELLFVTDLLVTDYSSVIFEASLLDIPMLFYSYDLQEYVTSRDFYYEYESFVPGKIVYNQNELTQSIVNKDFDFSKLDYFKNEFFDDTDGLSSQRVANKIIEILRR